MAHDAVAIPAGAESPAGFRGLMRNRNYALLWSGQLISEMGNRFHWVAVSLWIYSITQSAAAVSFAISSMFVGSLLVGLWAGVFVDKINRKGILIASDLIRGILVVLIPTLLEASLILVYVDLALISVATAFFRPAIFAIVPQVVSRRDLMAANSFFSAMETATEILGPIAAGFVAEKFGYAPLLYVDGLTYVFSALCIGGMQISSGSSLGQLSLRSVWSDVAEGLKYIRNDDLQRSLFALIFPATLVGAGLNALQTPLAKGEIRVSDAEFGAFQGVIGLGFVFASLLLGWYGGFIRKSWIIIGGYFLRFLSIGLMGWSTDYARLLTFGFFAGFANTLYYVGLGTVLMEHTPSHLVGRVISTRQTIISLALVLSPLAFGGLAESTGVRLAIALMAGVGALGTAIILWLFPAIRAFDRDWKSDVLRLRLLDALLMPIDSSLEETPQRRLNVLAVGFTALGWTVFAVVATRTAIALLVASIVLGVLGSSFKRRGWLP